MKQRFRNWMLPLLASVCGSGNVLAAQASLAARIRLVDQGPRRINLVSAGGAWHTTAAGLPGGADILYGNTTADLPLPFVPLAPGEAIVDDGGIPGPDSPADGSFSPGCALQYSVTGLEIAYCTDQPNVDVQLDFYDFFQVCLGPTGTPKPVLLTGLPGSTSPGTLECFVVGIDLRGSGHEFSLIADGDGVYDPPPIQGRNSFGVRFRVLNPVGSNTGPIFGGGNLSYTGTRWSWPIVDYSAVGDGHANLEWVFVEGVPWPSCYHVGWYTGTWLRLFGDACGALTGQALCDGGGSGTACPCSNASPSPNREGCANSVNGVNGGRLEAAGAASLSADGLSLLALRLPAATSVLFFQGTSSEGGGTGVVFGDGLRCAQGAIARLGTKSAVGGEARYPGPGDLPVSVRGGLQGPGTRFYQAWYRNSAAFCTPAAFNLTNGWQIDWQT